eukprot:1083016-Pelagomonas_calceolata.AAC.1
MACIYNTQGKCVGMIIPSRFQILYKAFYRDKLKLAGLHEAITPAPTRFASELQLLARKTMLENKHASKKFTRVTRVTRGWPTARGFGWSAAGETFSSSIKKRNQL